MITTCTVNLRFDIVLRMWDTNVKERPCPIIDPEVLATVRAVAQLQLFFCPEHIHNQCLCPDGVWITDCLYFLQL